MYKSIPTVEEGNPSIAYKLSSKGTIVKTIAITKIKT
jgi:hypothetical protein